MGTRILLADDCAAIRRTVKSLLEREGHIVVAEASNGADAVHLAVELTPDVVILDLSMPILDGFSAAREIRRHLPTAGLILLSVHAGEEEILTAMRCGMLAYVAKSDAGEDLLRAVREVSQGSRFLSLKPSRVILNALLTTH
jgi:DNA-binding NarL/FixJ family response regulator